MTGFTRPNFNVFYHVIVYVCKNLPIDRFDLNGYEKFSADQWIILFKGIQVFHGHMVMVEGCNKVSPHQDPPHTKYH